MSLLIEKGILTVGKNSDISNLEIVLPSNNYTTYGDSPSIRIGSDCQLNCKISLYSLSAKVEIGDRVYTGHKTEFFCYERITVGSDILFSWNITIIDTNAHSIHFQQRKNDVIDWKRGKKDWSNIISKPVDIKSKSWVGFNSIIAKGVTVNEGAVISSGSVVVKDVQAYTIVGGNPAVVIKELEGSSI